MPATFPRGRTHQSGLAAGGKLQHPFSSDKRFLVFDPCSQRIDPESDPVVITLKKECDRLTKAVRREYPPGISSPLQVAVGGPLNLESNAIRQIIPKRLFVCVFLFQRFQEITTVQ